MNTRTALLTALTLTACAPNIQDTGDVVVTDSGDSEGDTDASPLPGYPTLTGPCVLGTAQPRRLVVTTTDFATGAVSVIDAATDAVSADVALGSTDALPFAHGGYVYLLHRYTLDALDTLDADGAWATLSQQAIEAPDVSSANAHRLAFSDDGRAYMTLFGAPEIHQGVQPTATWRGEEYQHFTSGDARVTYVEGEFPWQVRVGDMAQTNDYVCPDVASMISIETQHTEDGADVNFTIMKPIAPAQVWAAFEMPGAPPHKSGVHPAEPNPHKTKFYALSFVALFVVWIVAMLAYSGALIARQITMLVT